MRDGQPRTGVTRRRYIRLAGAGTTACLAGCQSLDGEHPFREASTNATDAGAQPTVVDSTPDSVTIGVMRTDFGATVTNSARIAVDELNAREGVSPDVELISASGNASPEGEKQAYRKLMSEGADVTVGGLYPRGFLLPMAEEQKLHLTSVSPWPLPARLVSNQVSPVDGDPEAEYEKYKYFFRVGPLNLIDLQTAQVQLIEEYHDRLGWDRVGIIIENLNIGARDRLDSLESAISEHVEVPYAEVVGSSINDWTPIYDSLESADVDLVAIFLVLAAVVATEQWNNQQRPFEFGGIHLPAMQKSYWSGSNGAADSVWTMNAATPQTSNTPRTQPFLKEYQRRQGDTPAYPGILTYDAIKIYTHAVRAVGSKEPDKLVTFLEDDLAFTDGAFMPEFGFRGPDREFAHDPLWDDIQESGVPVFQQWQPADDGSGGVMEAFAPERNETAEYIRPPWMR